MNKSVELMKSLKQIAESFIDEAEVNPFVTSNLGPMADTQWPDIDKLSSIVVIFIDTDANEWSMSFDSVSEEEMNTNNSGEVGH